MRNVSKSKNTTLNQNTIRGIGSILGVFSGFYNQPVKANLRKTDNDSLSSDWEAVGNDFRTVCREIDLFI